MTFFNFFINFSNLSKRSCSYHRRIYHTGQSMCKMADEENAKLFSGRKIAEAYANFRPEYTKELYEKIFKTCQNGAFELAIDVGCGSGQSTAPLSSHFKRVVGIDVSDHQIREARLKQSGLKNIEFRVGPAEDLSLFRDISVDLITCAQALHWIKLDKFFAEVSRVLKPGGTLAAYGYGIWVLDQLEAEKSVMEFYNGPLGPFWGAGRKHVEEKYSGISLPFPERKRIDDLWIEKVFSVNDFIGYLSSWSAYHKYKEKHPDETELSSLASRLTDIYNEKMTKQGNNMVIVRWPIFLLIGQKPHHGH